MAFPSCLSCRAQTVQVLVDFGAQPPSNRFEHADFPSNETHPLVVGQCAACGLVQLVDAMPPAMAKARLEWLTYSEPEGHLDDLADRLRRLPGLANDARIVGLTYKDDSTLARLNRLGYLNTHRYDIGADWELPDPCASLESIQAAFAAAASRLAEKHGKADVLIARHVLEHAHDPLAFLASASAVVRPGGYLVLEVPDCTKFIQACDYSFVWEEHVTYFCPRTLAAIIAVAGFAPRESIAYPYPLEDALVSIVRNEMPADRPRPPPHELASLLTDGQAFSRRFPELRARMRARFGAWRREGKRITIFGAGHLAAKFLNLLSLTEYVDCVIDDNPRKQELLMPGSRLPILGSAAVDFRSAGLCLLSLNPASEQKLFAKYPEFLDGGGQFLSIFALSPKSVYNTLAP